MDDNSIILVSGTKEILKSASKRMALIGLVKHVARSFSEVNGKPYGDETQNTFGIVVKRVL